SELTQLREFIAEVHRYNDEIKSKIPEPLYCRSELIDSTFSNQFYVYDAIDSTSQLDKRYMLSLLTVREDGTKFTINISVDS
ncbi:28269_t:CDS:1, partial [Racocetra persica]